MIRSVLMVCTGNICRSPMAEFEMRRIAPRLTVSSAGVSALIDSPADKVAMAVAKSSGLDMRRHLARQVDPVVVYQHDLIIVMDDLQFQWMRTTFPEDRGKIVKMMHWTGGYDIPDPFRRSVQVYQAVFDKIQQGCAQWCQQLGITVRLNDNN